MKIFTIYMVSFLIALSFLAMPTFAEDDLLNDWENEFVATLQQGKTLPGGANTEGLAYTPDEETVLEEAIKTAMEKKAPPCRAMKIAVELEYNAFSVLTNIFGYGGEVDLDQLCGCATESGVKKEIIAQAARDAVTPLGEPVYTRDEITQAQCLTGLGYTPYAADIPRTDPEPNPNPLSVSAPGA